ncbi:hypothetical protein HCH_02823 [Hahella chejuensis KCTC 2396]|uniref:Uncharacterized protein n=1 Tax=Hahella chejuensis (strain KCTC 2396) TaxID=349521 RepID=Q2SIC3_HAHCH|nr:hypothetical protein HCH_02823 [Hahella chejuensis KCTC 2396]
MLKDGNIIAIFINDFVEHTRRRELNLNQGNGQVSPVIHY